MSRILLVEPAFPVPAKSRNHKNFLPVGLLKIAAYLRDRGEEVKLVRGLTQDLTELTAIEQFGPDEVWVTSLFTYWSGHVRAAVQRYKAMFPSALIRVGGIYASLFPQEEVKEYTGCDDVHQGVMQEVEEHARSHPPAYELLESVNPSPIDFQIVHASRGCPRECPFCGTWRIEPQFEAKRSIKDEIHLPGIVFYDNNFLMNPHVADILDELITLRRQGRVKWVESESGLDGRVLLEKPHLAQMIRDAGFRYPRIAWDWGFDQYPRIYKQVELLERAGYQSRDLFVFVLYNHDISFEEMERKRLKCWEWQVQIADCRFRPLDQLVDGYDPRATAQTSEEYFVGEGWNDALVRQFRRNVRRQNICVRMRYPIYSDSAERKRLDKQVLQELRGLATAKQKGAFLEALGADWWIPDRICYPEGYTLQMENTQSQYSREGHVSVRLVP
jgi:hypothetical protein